MLLRLSGSWILLAPILLLYLITFFVPMGSLFVASMASTTLGSPLSSFIWVVSDSSVRAILLDTLAISAGTAAICLAFGFPLAYQAARGSSTLRLVILTLVIFPLLTSSVVRTFGWQVILFPNGVIANAAEALGVASPPALIGTKLGVAIALAGVLMPFMVLTLFNTISGVDGSLEEAALDLGDRPSQVWRRVTLPLCKNGVIGGTLLVFSLALSAYVTPRLIGQSRMQTLSTMIYDQAVVLIRYDRAAAVSVVLLVVTVVIAILITKFFKEG